MDTGPGERQRIKEYCNKQFYQAANSSKRLRIFQGGTRSGKSWSLMQYCLYLMTTEKEPLTISIVRKTLPALKRSVLRDFQHIAKGLGIYFKGIHNKTDNTFEFNGHTLEFFSTDDPQKIRGSARDILWMNEGNECFEEDFRQLALRTRQYILIDFNPSDPIHYLYDLADRDDADLFISTYKDNKFLPTETVNEIERLKEKDPDYWRVFGEGKRAIFSDRQIFKNWKYIPHSDFPEFDETVLGIDFGYTNDPAVIVEVGKVGDKLYIHEWLYRTGMTNRDMANFIKQNNLQDTLAFADSAEPKSIEELRQMGCLVKGAIKGQGSINAGISLIKEYEVFVSESSKNVQREQRTYFWDQLKDGTIINKPLSGNDHTTDALRYAVYSKWKNRYDFYVI
jgi:phage terminase large subunit